MRADAGVYVAVAKSAGASVLLMPAITARTGSGVGAVVGKKVSSRSSADEGMPLGTTCVRFAMA